MIRANCKECKFYLDLKTTNANGCIRDQKICLNDGSTCWKDGRLEFIIVDRENKNFVKKHGCSSYKKIK